jgi:hypothetical protein
MKMAREELRWRREGKAWALHLGRKAVSLVIVRPDETYAGMFRIHWADGQVSDMVNLSRAKDAALSMCATEARKARRARRMSGRAAA